jgi:hypothetical protein
MMDEHSTIESEHEQIMNKHDEIRKDIIDSNSEIEPQA